MSEIRSRKLFAVAPARLVAGMCGLLDSSAWIAAGWGEPGSGAYFSIYYAIALPIKVAILLTFIRTVRPGNATVLWPIYLPIAITVFVSVITGNTTVEGVVQPIGTLTSLALTVLILRNDNFKVYMTAFGASCFMSCVTFLFQLYFVPLNTSGLWEASGRYSFIFLTQPNLGGEILFTGFIALCIARFNAVSLIAVFLLYFAVISLLGSRAAMLSILFAFLLYVYVVKIRSLDLGLQIVVVSTLALLLVLFGTLNFERISNLLSLNDQYRGVGTGYVGREEHWESAWTVFLESPFFGIGFGFFRHDVVTPHSMWLGMLSIMGAMSLFVLAAMWKNGSRIYAANFVIFVLLLSFAPMTIFNDRFLNLNPYPFLFFVILFLPKDVLIARDKTASFRVARSEGTRQKLGFGATRRS